MTLLSSRTFPGHGWRASFSRASVAIGGAGLRPISEANRSRNDWASGRISAARSRSGGRWIVTPLSR